MKHTPVLLSTVLDLLDPREGEVVIDVTVGLGGHARAFLERIGTHGKLIGIDADGENVRTANGEIRKYPPGQAVRPPDRSRAGTGENAKMIHANFRDLPSIGLPPCDILFADLGLSSPHLDDPSRGFSFRSEGPLDCRFDRTKGRTAATLLLGEREENLLRMFQEYGELKDAQKLSACIVKQRKLQSIRTTQDLVKIVEGVYGWRAKGLMAQVFQALRIAVNDELGALQVLLAEGPKLLKSGGLAPRLVPRSPKGEVGSSDRSEGGRMGIISYHSLEDRMVKQRFRECTAVEKHPVTGAPLVNGVGFQLLTKRAARPTLEEVERNPRARSARFRAIRKAP